MVIIEEDKLVLNNVKLFSMEYRNEGKRKFTYIPL
jgi:hypothetical protein